MEGLTEALNKIAAKSGRAQVSQEDVMSFMGNDAARILDGIQNHIHGKITMEELAALAEVDLGDIDE